MSPPAGHGGGYEGIWTYESTLYQLKAAQRLIIAGLAVDASQPGGVTFARPHWCAEHEEFEWAEDAAGEIRYRPVRTVTITGDLL